MYDKGKNLLSVQGVLTIVQLFFTGPKKAGLIVREVVLCPLLGAWYGLLYPC